MIYFAETTIFESDNTSTHRQRHVSRVLCPVNIKQLNRWRDMKIKVICKGRPNKKNMSNKRFLRDYVSTEPIKIYL